MIQCKSADEPATAEDGRRVLVERLRPPHWPREQMSVHTWLPDLAPSTDLLNAFNTGVLDFAQFTAKYRRELAAHPAHWWALLSFAETATLTLVCAATDPRQNHAVVLAQWLEEELDRHAASSSPVCYRDEFTDY